MIFDLFPVPVYVVELDGYNKNLMIGEIDKICDKPYNEFDQKLKDPNVDRVKLLKQYFVDQTSYFGDTKKSGHIHFKPGFQWLNDQIKYHTTQYLDGMGYLSDCDIAVQKSWAVRLNRGGSVQPHRHINSHISCVFYLQTGESSLKFIRPPTHCTEYLPLQTATEGKYSSNESFVPVESGMLVLFPAQLRHMVEPYDDETTRYSVSYDLMLVAKKPMENMVVNPKQWKFL
jgi:uncharacterized protein (TIGR02466 family)